LQGFFLAAFKSAFNCASAIFLLSQVILRLSTILADGRQMNG